MGDLSELRGLITVIAFMGVFTLFLSWVPPQLYVADDYRSIYTPDQFEAIEIYAFADYEALVNDESSGHVDVFDSTIWIYEDFVLGNWDLDFAYRRANQSNLICTVKHEAWNLIVFPDFHHLSQYDTNGVEATSGGWLTVDAIDDNKEPNGYVSRFRAECGHFALYVFFSFNISDWSTFEEAWNHEELNIFFGIDFDDVNTSYNAFHLVSMLLFFSLPEIPIYIQAPISISLWACIAYLLYVLIIKMFPFLGG